LIQKILKVTGYLEKFDKKNEEDLGRLENIAELIVVANEIPKIELFLESVTLIQAEDLADQGKAKPQETLVNLMTIHSAKGLEFDNVFVVGLEEGLLPHSRSLIEKEELEEERRLLYVAITRAKQRLFLSFVLVRFLYGEGTSQTPSRFLSEVPERLIASVTGLASKKFHLGGARVETQSPSEEKFSKRRVVADWEIEKESADDFNDIDSW